MSSSSELVAKKKLSGREKREELEREVSELRKMLDHEHKVNEILDKVHHQTDRSTSSVPKLLPPKMKELLAELAMVEDEIARLESQIDHLQANLKNEKEMNKDYKFKHLHNSAISSPLPPVSNFSHTYKEDKYERNSPFEAKAL